MMVGGADALGGYPGLDFRRGPWVHQHAILLNSGRSCLEYILVGHGKRGVVHVPSYICSAIFDTLDRIGADYRCYPVHPDLRIDAVSLERDDLLIYPNYFGLMDEYCDEMSQRYGERLIVDCAQALYYTGADSSHRMYSPRKFVGVPDGGCLYTSVPASVEWDEDRSSERLTYLARRLEDGAEAGYPGFLEAESQIERSPPRRMSALTRTMLEAADHDHIVARRRANYALLHSLLGSANAFAPAAREGVCPLAYPFLGSPELRKSLIAQRIFVPTYWPNVAERPASATEQALALNLLALPIDQRLGESDMHRIAEAVRCR